MTTLTKNSMKVPTNNLRQLVVCQILGLVAMGLIIFAVANHHYRYLAFAVFLIPMVLLIPKPNLIIYVFIVCFFLTRTVYHAGWLLSIKNQDIIFFLLFLAFIAHKKTNIFKATLEKQRTLLIILCAFALWAIVGFIVNYYTHTVLANVTSAFFVFKIFQLVAAVILFSQPQWKEPRDKIIVFFLICALFEVFIAVGLEILRGARTLADFHKLNGTVGGHHAMLGNVLMLSIGVAAGVFFEMRNNRKKTLALCVAILSGVLIIVSGSRSVLLGLIMATPIALLLASPKKWCKLSVVILPVIAIFTMLGVPAIRDIIINTMVISSVDGVDMSAYGRLLIWERVYEHALYGPLLQRIVGIGIGTFDTLTFSYFLEAGTFTTGAHNNFMHVFVETGIVGFILYAAIFVDIIWRLVARSRQGDNAAKCFLFSTLALLFSCLTQETFWFNPSFERFWLMYMFFYLILFNFNANTSKESQEMSPAVHISDHKARFAEK